VARAAGFCGGRGSCRRPRRACAASPGPHTHTHTPHPAPTTKGSADAAVLPSGIGGFIACKALSKRNDAPAAASRPWDKNRDGFVMGEGAGESAFLSRRGAQGRLGGLTIAGAAPAARPRHAPRPARPSPSLGCYQHTHTHNPPPPTPLGVLVLEELSHALARGAKIYGAQPEGGGREARRRGRARGGGSRAGRRRHSTHPPRPALLPHPTQPSP
jgi:hypothetical protein